jgi:hypothetical protein
MLTLREFWEIQIGDRVTVSTPQGGSRSGVARVFNRDAGVIVLNGGGAHGTPVIATPHNVIKVNARRH